MPVSNDDCDAVASHARNRLQSDRDDRCQDRRRHFPFVAQGAVSIGLPLPNQGAVAAPPQRHCRFRCKAIRAGAPSTRQYSGSRAHEADRSSRVQRQEPAPRLGKALGITEQEARNADVAGAPPTSPMKSRRCLAAPTHRAGWMSDREQGHSDPRRGASAAFASVLYRGLAALTPLGAPSWDRGPTGIATGGLVAIELGSRGRQR